MYGSRFLRGMPKGMKLRNLVANLVLSAAATILYGQRVTDEATGYKVFRRSVLDHFELSCRRFEFCPEFTGNVAQGRLPHPRGPDQLRAPRHPRGQEDQGVRRLRGDPLADQDLVSRERSAAAASRKRRSPRLRADGVARRAAAARRRAGDRGASSRSSAGSSRSGRCCAGSTSSGTGRCSRTRPACPGGPDAGRARRAGERRLAAPGVVSARDHVGSRRRRRRSRDRRPRASVSRCARCARSS